MTSNAVPPSVTYPSPDEWPNTLRTITGITKANQANITCASHGFTSTDQGQTFVMFKQVVGMIQINGQNALVQTGWKGPRVEGKTWRKVLLNGIASLDWRAVIRDVEPFLEDPRDRQLLERDMLLSELKRGGTGGE